MDRHHLGPPERASGNGAGELTSDANRSPLLEARNIKKSFGQTPALRGVNVTVHQGDFLAVMGPSGSGKSTMLHCLAGIFRPDEGEVWYGDRRLDKLSDAERTRLRRTDFGFLFQFGQLVPELTAADNVALPMLLNRANRKTAYRAATSWLSRLGLEDKGSRRIGELSGGESQRVAIARAFAITPKVLFADEPTGSLDSLTSEKVMEMLVNVSREQGITTVLITHDARVAAYADREVIVRDGRLGIEAGGPGAHAGSSGNVTIKADTGGPAAQRS
ncbi:MAG: ABC transporter ATP-binding protein [Trebonia sp.]